MILIPKNAKIAALALASTAAAALEMSLLSNPLTERILFSLLTAAAPPALLHFYYDYREAKKTSQLEEALPAALFQIASFPKRTSMEKIVRSVARSDYGELSAAFAKAERLVNAGMSVPEAFEEMKKRNNSILLNRAASLLMEAYKSGADMGNAFREVAEDIFDLQSARKEAAGAVALQKYTLLAGGCLLVPIILALVLNIVGGLGFDSALGLGASAAERQAVFDTSVWAGQAYLVIFCGIASVFAASQEGNAKKAALYFALLAPTSLLLFNAVRGISLLA